jgi:hypothetical protein
VQRCRNNAETADKKAREFWLNLARRWEELSHARNGGNTNVRAARELPLTRTIYSSFERNYPSIKRADLCRVADRWKSDVGWIASSIFNGWRPKAPSLRLLQKSWFPEANPSINSHFTNSCSNRASLSLRVVGSFASRLQARVATIAANGALCLCNGGWHADDYSLVSAMVQRTVGLRSFPSRFTHMLRHLTGYKLANDGHDTRPRRATLRWRRIGSKSFGETSGFAHLSASAVV